MATSHLNCFILLREWVLLVSLTTSPHPGLLHPALVTCVLGRRQQPKDPDADFGHSDHWCLIYLFILLLVYCAKTRRVYVTHLLVSHCNSLRWFPFRHPSVQLEHRIGCPGLQCMSMDFLGLHALGILPRQPVSKGLDGPASDPFAR